MASILTSGGPHSYLLVKSVKRKDRRNTNFIIVLDFANLFFAGLLAGIEFVIHYGWRAPAEALDERSQL